MIALIIIAFALTQTTSGAQGTTTGHGRDRPFLWNGAVDVENLYY